MLIHGVWAGLVAAGTALWIDPKDWALWSDHFFRMFGGVFFLQGGMRAAQFYMNNPLPPSDSTPPFPVEQARISMNPLNKVQSIPDPGTPPKP